MESTTTQQPALSRHRARVLLVADWTVDPEAVIATCVRRDARLPATYSLLVPARLHGVDWMGDPAVSGPCAQRQLAHLAELAEAAHLDFRPLGVGDPNVLASIEDALMDAPADELLLFFAKHRLGLFHTLGLRRRARRLTGLEVSQVRLPLRPDVRKRGWLGGHCTFEQPLTLEESTAT